jgi:hypothetical protein
MLYIDPADGATMAEWLRNGLQMYSHRVLDDSIDGAFGGFRVVTSLIGHRRDVVQDSARGCCLPVEFTPTQVEPGLWKWEFQIGETATTEKTKTNLRGMKVYNAD